MESNGKLRDRVPKPAASQSTCKTTLLDEPPSNPPQEAEINNKPTATATEPVTKRPRGRPPKPRPAEQV